MTESLEHSNLVRMIVSYIKSDLDLNLCQPLIEVDLQEQVKPNPILGYIPDVYYAYHDTLIIGEAKTADDFNRKHSKKQFEAYLQYCNESKGLSLLFIAIPWQLKPMAKNYFIRLKKEYGYSCKILILTTMGGVDEV